MEAFSHIRCLGIVEQVWDRVVVLFGLVVFIFYLFLKPNVCVCPGNSSGAIF